MKFEKMCYSYSKMQYCADMVKAANWTVKHKNEHFAKWVEIKSIFEYARDNINSFLFDPDSELKKYSRMAYDYKQYTKKELDQELRRVYLYICNELNDILTMMRSGEVDSSD